MELFLGYDKREKKIKQYLKLNGFKDLKEAKSLCESNGIFVDQIIKGIQPIAFDNAIWAYTAGVAVALKKGLTSAMECAKEIGQALQAWTVSGSVAERRECGIGHGNLGAKLLDEQTECFAFIAGHESFAAAEGAVALARTANKSRQKPLRVVLVGLGKDAAYIIARMKGFTYVKTALNYCDYSLNEISRVSFSCDERKEILIYGADSVMEGVEILKKEQVDISITGNSTNPTRFQHPVAGTYKKWCVENRKDYFSIASGGGTGRTLHPDNLGAGPASYGLTDTMGRMHADAQFAGSSSVPAHVDMMGFIGMGNNPMVGATVALAVLASKAR